MELSDRSTDELMRGRKKALARRKVKSEALREVTQELKNGEVTVAEVAAAAKAVEAEARKLRLIDEELDSRRVPELDPFHYGTAPVETPFAEG